MAQIPGGLVSDLQGALELQGTHAFFGLADKEHSGKPLRQR